MMTTSYSRLRARGAGNMRGSGYALLNANFSSRYGMRSPWWHLASGLKERQVLIDLPLGHLTVVGGPFAAFQLDELVGNRAERRLDHLVLAQLLDCLVQRLRKNADALAPNLGERAIVHVAEVRLAGIELLLDAVQPSRDVGGQRQVGVAARRYGAVLEVTGPGGTDHLRAIVVAVGDERRRPGEAAPRGEQSRPQLQPLVAVDRRTRHGTQGASVTEHATEEVICCRRAAEAASIGGVVEQRLARLDVGEVVVDVQSAAGAVAERLRHVRQIGSA